MSSILLLSGGLDSLVLLAREVEADRVPLCLSIDYGQRHRRELVAAREIVAAYGVRRVEIALPPAVLAGSALTGQAPIPRGLHHADPRQSATVVPGRNLVFLAVAASQAVSRGLGRVLFAAHAGDAPIYPDCRPEFVAAADATFSLGCGVAVEAPFLSMDKRAIVRLGRSLGAPLHLAWSCYVGGETPCGTCGACVERAEAEDEENLGGVPNGE